jgi:hypothetical protein
MKIGRSYYDVHGGNGDEQGQAESVERQEELTDEDEVFEYIFNSLEASEKMQGFFSEFATAKNMNAIYAAGILCSSCSTDIMERAGKMCPLSTEIQTLSQILLLSTIHIMARERRALLELIETLMRFTELFIPDVPRLTSVLEKMKKVLKEVPSDLPEHFEIPEDRLSFRKESVDLLHDALAETIAQSLAISDEDDEETFNLTRDMLMKIMGIYE